MVEQMKTTGGHEIASIFNYNDNTAFIHVLSQIHRI